jgi:UDP-GlcNAc:undecaprenyl-phosphate GlcNAc-1-phosphate transferase
MFLKFFLSIIISALLSFIFSPFVRKFFIQKGWIEYPEEKQKKTHNATALQPVPRGGGIIIFLAIFITSCLFLKIDKHFIGIFSAGLIALIIGVWDDIKDISPKIRLMANLAVGLIIVLSGIGITFISNPFGGILDLSSYNYLSDILAIFWIVWCMNIVGWSTGVDGQLPGFTAISAFFIGLLAFRFSQDILQWPVIILAGSVSGAFLGFLPFNVFPQVIMPGYSGKSLAGFFLAVLAILSGAKLATVILLLGIPMIDAIFVLIKRCFQKKPLFISDDNHLHHQLLKSGWSRSRIAIFYWSISFVLGLISLFLNSSQKFYVFIGLFILFCGFLISLYRRK